VVTYRERPTGIAGVVLWQRRVGPAPSTSRILPDGCMDLIWDGERLFVAGPDLAARWHHSPGGTSYTGLRFAGGTGPAWLRVPADEVRGQCPDLSHVWARTRTQRLLGQVAADPAGALPAWLRHVASEANPDPIGPEVLRLTRAGASVARIAERVGFSARQLHRRCLPVFGYGPRRLGRVLRLGTAIDAVRSGRPLAQVASDCGYADQAHLTREMRALAGTTPTGLLRELRE
jgi:AraC-like DNA-binding protein